MKKGKKLIAFLLTCTMLSPTGGMVFAEEAEEELSVTVEAVDRENTMGSWIVVGSDGVKHDGVDYLTVEEVKGLSDVQKENYAALADEAAETAESGIENTGIELVVNKKNIPELRCSFPMKLLREPEFTPETDVIRENTPDTDGAYAMTEAGSFDRTAYFRDQLNDLQQELFDAGLRAASLQKNKFRISSPADQMDILYALSATYTACPEEFEWADWGSDAYSFMSYNNKKRVFCGMKVPKAKYYSGALERSAKSLIKRLVKEAESYAKTAYPEDPEYGICEYFDEWLCKQNYYNNKGTKAKFTKKPVYYYCHSSYGCLLKGYGVCESYARAMSRLLDTAGLTNLFVCGEAGDYVGGGHAWNYVQLDGSWYMLDSTWDDPEDETEGSTKKYFLIGSTAEDGYGTFHSPNGTLFYGIPDLTFPELSPSSYGRDEESEEWEDPWGDDDWGDDDWSDDDWPWTWAA
ncbi:MAG: hypothetical protein IJT16_07295 [Lachnospiraceae bacterium]|nr:hypothetical protein [Lachnospiraceae bacterium]